MPALWASCSWVCGDVLIALGRVLPAAGLSVTAVSLGPGCPGARTAGRDALGSWTSLFRGWWWLWPQNVSLQVGVPMWAVWKCINFLQQLTEPTVMFAVKRNGKVVFPPFSIWSSWGHMSIWTMTLFFKRNKQEGQNVLFVIDKTFYLQFFQLLTNKQNDLLLWKKWLLFCPQWMSETSLKKKQVPFHPIYV